ncbi:venom prothrombin activator omicarin-Cnon-catalytic subunit [Striga asiatica]|uniref:Venom prothrombin activator omicarin-Cnon-catalytic subunit n=1 Tax=Striga asiatica TaxID=4170 RepID=A0A5A7PDB6_STRAF|nr:venom prothrombin activator omicarin-Cnon-catalytic subunit [Striga asiatica]
MKLKVVHRLCEDHHRFLEDRLSQSNLEDIRAPHEHHLEAMKQKMEMLKTTTRHRCRDLAGEGRGREDRRSWGQINLTKSWWSGAVKREWPFEGKEIVHAEGFKMCEENGIEINKEMGEGSEVTEAANLVEAERAVAIQRVLKTLQRGQDLNFIKYVYSRKKVRLELASDDDREADQDAKVVMKEHVDPPIKAQSISRLDPSSIMELRTSYAETNPPNEMASASQGDTSCSGRDSTDSESWESRKDRYHVERSNLEGNNNHER